MLFPPDFRRFDCEKCRTNAGAFPTYMIVCPNCGNKRCPQAIDHRNICTRSNEPNQDPQLKDIYKRKLLPVFNQKQSWEMTMNEMIFKPLLTMHTAYLHLGNLDKALKNIIENMQPDEEYEGIQLAVKAAYSNGHEVEYMYDEIVAVIHHHYFIKPIFCHVDIYKLFGLPTPEDMSE